MHRSGAVPVSDCHHDIAKAGIHLKTGECRYCRKARIERERTARRRAGLEPPKSLSDSKTIGRNGNVEHKNESLRAKQVLALIDAKIRAGTAWERNEIKQQIDALIGRRVSHGS
jgi:hypothetical protein